MAREKHRTPPPLDAGGLDRLALRYVERFATSEGKLARYLTRKLRERGWEDEQQPDVIAVVKRLAGLGYVDDRGFGEARARGLERRGYGARRIGEDLRAAGIAEDLRAEIAGTVDARAAAVAYARRRRFGPFGAQPADKLVRARQFSAMLRAGHDMRLTSEILSAASEDALVNAAGSAG